MKARGSRPPAVVRGSLTPVMAVEALQQLVGQVIEYRRIVANERVRQEEIRAQRDVILAEIAMRREILLNAADKVFQERRETLGKMFDGLEQAVEKGDSESVGQVLSGIVALAKHSPLADVRALAKDLSSDRFVLDLSSEKPAD